MRRDRKHHGQDYEREYPYRGDWGEGSVPAEGRLGWWDLPVSRTEYGGQDWRGDEFTHNVPVRNQFRGVGPRHYRRSDERIREDVCDRLTDHPMIDASDVDVQVKEGEVFLGGTVDSRQTKRMVDQLVEGVWGVREIFNEIRIKRAA